MPVADTEEDVLGAEVPNFPPVPEPVQPAPQAPSPPLGPMGPQLIRPPQPMQLNVPAQTFSDPAYQQQLEKETLAIAQRAKSYAQAEHDVSSARRILGVLAADRAIKSGVPVDKAMYDNIQYFVNPGDKNFAPTLNAVRPPPAAPSIQNFTIPGTTNQVPAIVAPTRTGNQVHIVPRSAMPQPEDTSTSTPAKPILSDKGELLGYTIKTGPQTFSHKWLADMDTGIKQQIKNNDLEIRELIRDKHAIEKEAGAAGDKADAAKLTENATRIRELQQKNIDLATGGKSKPVPPIVGASTPSAIPDAPIQPRLRRAGQLYTTPKGVFKWTGSGWESSQ